jgi:hypothetical protein
MEHNLDEQFVVSQPVRAVPKLLCWAWDHYLALASRLLVLIMMQTFFVRPPWWWSIKDAACTQGWPKTAGAIRP